MRDIGLVVWGLGMGAFLMNWWWMDGVRRRVRGIRAAMQPDLEKIDRDREDFIHDMDKRLGEIRELSAGEEGPWVRHDDERGVYYTRSVPPVKPMPGGRR